MSNKKIWAYAKNELGNYVNGERHPLKIFYIWEALKLRDNNIHEFKKFTFVSTQKDPERRREMWTVKNGFYRYKNGQRIDEVFDKDGGSLSHSIAIRVLAEMEKINFFCGDHVFSVDVEEIRTDDVKIQLLNRDRYEYYYPDLICTFKSPNNYAEKWGNKLVIEVKHTHPCEKEKIYDFENHCIPIIEVDIENISIETVFNTKDPTPDQLEEYYFYLKEIFDKEVNGVVLSNPVTAVYFRKYADTTSETIRTLESQVNIYEKDVNSLLEEKEKLMLRTNNIANDRNRLELLISKKDEKIRKMEEMGVVKFLFQYVKSKIG